MTKLCSACGQIKSRSLFKGTTSYCSPCASEYQKRLRKMRKSHAVPKNHRCYICRRTSEQIPTATNSRTGHKKTPWRIDHCHSTGVFRGFICRNCNTGLGAFRDRPLILLRAALYLIGSRVLPKGGYTGAKYILIIPDFAKKSIY